MPGKGRAPRIGSGWLATAFVLVVVTAVAISYGAFNKSFTPTVPVTLTSDRSGLVMEPYAKVKLRGVQVGRVATVAPGTNEVSLRLDIDPEMIRFIPANVEAKIQATSLFGAKFVDLVYPSHPSPKRLAAGAVLKSENVSVEVNTVFQNLVGLIKQIDPSKINAVLGAFAEGVRGQGDNIGRAITDSNEVLTAMNARSDTIDADWRALQQVSDTYNAAAQHILNILSAASTTSVTVTNQSKQLDSLLLNVIGLSRSGVDLLAPNKDNFIKAFNSLQSTAQLLMKYNPEVTCLLVGAKTLVDNGLGQALGGNGKSLIMDAALMLGDDPYRYPDNLPIVAAKGGEGGKPSCGSLPDVEKNWPVRSLIANTGYGTGVDLRPNPGIGFPGYIDYLPVTRGIPQPPSIRYLGPPAPGPIPYPGAPPYGAPQYGPDGAPLYPGVPPAPPAPADGEAAPAPASPPPADQTPTPPP